ncbi:PstS family phosphate ABC transporter substrate-binding protein [Streptomyces sp. ADMS]|uniref:PstS family phosphate ABC transporter substrate-binding protein n=1 Tax=Streptomyces sp. ADMS TaxID=3071415 RepID=UPI00296E7550|nr:PstS family phosphate ABC transporter substrate-binding protein [Streptomyces sp. ADMS]MDW4910028.1 PstS family phosphate ABC transporter substrate-binding protein [Streptomyces sp. ADMS]
MNISTSLRRAKAPLALTAAVMLAASACGGGDADSGGSGDELSGKVAIDGSSTVAPLTSAASEFYAEEPGKSKVQVTVATSGTGGGFKKFCVGETDISNASRAIKDEEIKTCEENNVKYEQFSVANDGLSVVVSKDNDWADCLTVEQLKKIWEPGSKVNNWNQVDSKFPDEPLKLFGAGTDSGTFDYFTDAINGEEGASRTDYSGSEDDNVTVTGVSGTKGGMGYFGFSYYEENADKLKLLQVDGGDGCVTPSVETVQDGTYQPLGRQLFIYPSAEALKKPQVLDFVEFYVGNHKQIAEDSKFIPLNAEQETELEAALDKLKKANP